jgi:uncharacterized membrane protein (UPF0127 family)
MNYVIIGTNKFSTEIQRTEWQHAQGMQGRTWQGLQSMYFEMSPRMHSFHTQNCLVPMDIIFVNNGKIIKIHPNCVPNSGKSYVGFGDAVVELPANTVFKYRITPGQSVTLWQQKDHI